MTIDAPQDFNVLRLKQVEKKTGLKRSTIYKRMSDGTFPRKITLGGSRSVGWLENDIHEWLKQCIAKSK